MDVFRKKTEWRKRRFGESLELSRQEWEMGHKSGQLLLAIISLPCLHKVWLISTPGLPPMTGGTMSSLCTYAMHSSPAVAAVSHYMCCLPAL